MIGFVMILPWVRCLIEPTGAIILKGMSKGASAKELGQEKFLD